VITKTDSDSDARAERKTRRSNYAFLKNLKQPIAFLALAFTVLVPFGQVPAVQAITTPAGCTLSETSMWTNYAFAPQTGTFTATVDATPNAAVTDGLIGLSTEGATAYTDLAAIVRFSSVKVAIDARNGGVYDAIQTIPYVVGTTYHFRIVVNIPNHTYSAYVTPAGGTEKTIGTNFAFRSEQATAKSLAFWAPFSDVQTFKACNWNISGVTDTKAPSVPQSVVAAGFSTTAMKVSWKKSTDDVSVAGYNIYQDGGLIASTKTLNISYIVTGLIAPTSHTYAVAAYDTSGNTSSKSSSVTGTISTPIISPVSATPGGSYDQAVLADHPVAFWDLNPKSATEADQSGNGHMGTYKNGTPSAVTLPDGEQAADFNGSSQYVNVPSSNAFSISTTGNLTWEAWVRADTFQFPTAGSDAYVDFMGKCAEYGPTCEWESRIYDSTTPEGRGNRLSAYVFNSSAGLGSAADWQPTDGLISTEQWVHVVGEYTTQSQPSNCSNAGSYPGSINIWVNGVKWSQASHTPTGCMSQYSVRPTANTSPLTIGTMAMDYWFKGAIGKVAIYNYQLSQTQINSHYQVMTKKAVTGSCAAECSF
jgi:hypothetical protein